MPRGKRDTALGNTLKILLAMLSAIGGVPCERKIQTQQN
jgi:hypothetical protein